MFLNRQQKSTPIDSWKVRSINGFEKYLFPNIQLSTKSIPKYKLINNIDPSRFIYPRDAMGNMLIPLFNRTIPIFTPFYLPKYDFIKTRSPAWTIKNRHDSKRIIHHVGPMTYDSVNDKSQLPCKSGWTQTGRRAFNIQLGLTVPFYDTRKYKQVGDPCSKHAVISKRQTTRREVKSKKLPIVIKRKSSDDMQDHEAIAERDTSIYRQSHNLIASDVQNIRLKILPSEEFKTFTNQSTDGAINK